jgi:Ricin-type beta-trefoil lectin domain-like
MGRYRSRIIRTLAVFGVVAGMLTAVPPAANADALIGLRNSFYQGQCLDADASAPPNTAPRVQVWGCNGQPQQHWIAHFKVNDGGDIYYSLENQRYPGQCLDADINGPVPGARVQVWACNDTTEQLWAPIPRNGNDGQLVGDNWINFYFRDHCLDADAFAAPNTSPRVYVQDCSRPYPAAQQLWWR